MHRLLIDRAEPLRHLRNEWLLTNGLGGYAMGTALGANTRRYHGLLVAATKPPLGRILALHSVIEQLVTPDGTVTLAMPQFARLGASPPTPSGSAHAPPLHVADESPFALPPGQRSSLLRFEHEPNVRTLWVYRVGQVIVEKELSLRAGANRAELSYCLRHIPGPMTLRLRPLVALRDFHDLGHEHAGAPACEQVHRNGFALRQGEITLTIEGMGGANISRIAEPEWWRHFVYEEDARRGQDFTEDVYSPGLYEARIARAQADVVLLKAAVHIEGQHWPDPPARITASRGAPPLCDAPIAALRTAAEQFIACRLDGNAWHTTVLAGFPWFADWGRDTMISLPGLLLATQRHEEAASALDLFARHERKGLVPNRFDDYGGAPEYNTVDASLWFIHAVHTLRRQSPARVSDTMRRACANIITHYISGTDFNIRMDQDGLIACGGPDTQITWMDAKRNGIVFTPRHGKPVEIAALWHHALRCANELLDDDARRDEWTTIADRAAAGFQRFWWQEQKCLHDVLVQRDGQWIGDARLRPNQLFAVSLEHSPLTKEQQRSVVDAARTHLLTPVGLRTLAPGSEGYIGRFEGDMMQRDRAYHNGTVWPWLIGTYCEALLRAHEFSNEAKHEARRTIAPLLAELETGCLGQLAEVYDGDPPHRPAGCPAQAWSVAEALRVLSMLDA